MEQFWGFENEKSISETVRQGKIEIKILRTSLIMSTGVSNFWIPFFPNRHIIFRSSSLSLCMVPSRLTHERSFCRACHRGFADGQSISINGRGSNNWRMNLQRDGFRAVFGVLNKWRLVGSPASEGG